MARIAGINIPMNKHVWVGLTHIYGIGNARSKSVCEAAGVNPHSKVKDLTESEVNAIRSQIAKFAVEGDLRGERRALAGAAEAATTGGRPGKRVSLAIGDRDDGVVEGSVDVRDRVEHVLTRLLRLLGAAGLCRRATLLLVISHMLLLTLGPGALMPCPEARSV